MVGPALAEAGLAGRVTLTASSSPKSPVSICSRRTQPQNCPPGLEAGCYLGLTAGLGLALDFFCPGILKSLPLPGHRAHLRLPGLVPTRRCSRSESGSPDYP